MISPADRQMMALLVLAATFILVGLITALAMRIIEFSKDLRYINREISRTEGAERRYWQRQKRQLWLSLIPFYRR